MNVTATPTVILTARVSDEQLGVLILPLAIFHSIITTTGVCGNLIMCYVTIRAKHLQSPCHVLIGIHCFCDALHGSAHFPFLYGLYTNTKWILQRNCYFLILLPAFGDLMGMCLLLSLGSDRLFAILIPTFYRSKNNKVYVLAQLLAPLTYSIGFIVYAWFKRNDIPVMCVIPEFFWKMTDWTWTCVGINASTLLVYLLVFYKLRTSSLSKSARSVFKSIFVTVLFVVLGWCTTKAIGFTGIFMGATGNDLFLFQGYSGVPVNSAAACNVFVYYSISTDYRMAIRQQIFRDKTTEKRTVSVTQTATETLSSRRMTMVE